MLSTLRPFKRRWRDGRSTTEPRSSDLYIVLHGFRSSPKRIRHVCSVISDDAGPCDIFCPQLPLGALDIGDPFQIARSLSARIEELFSREGSEYERVHLVGYSAGAVLARLVCLYGLGYLPVPVDGAGARAPARWAQALSRLILLAGINMGWSISHHMGRPKVLAYWLASQIPHALVSHLTMFRLRRGGVVITAMRLAWLRMRRDDKYSFQIYQLLGTQDDLVSPDDAVDPLTGSDFTYLELPHTGHRTAAEMDPKDERGRVRRDIFSAVIRGDQDAIERHRVPVFLSPPTTPDKRVESVVIVLHGIRDLGYWTRKIASQVLKTAEESGHGGRVVALNPTYGYFAMLPFILPWTRVKKVEWFMEKYAEIRALYPNANVSFFGHSNGTYILAHALKEYPDVQFENVGFAGSVVRRNYRWQEGRVRRVVNYVATSDFVVAIFPRLFEIIRVQDLGSAGHDGFELRSQSDQLTVDGRRYVDGAHSAALVEDNWRHIARFLVNGEMPPARTPFMRDRRRWWAVGAGFLCVGIWAVILGVVIVALPWLIWKGGGNLGLEEWAKTLLLVAYGGIVYKTLTWF